MQPVTGASTTDPLEQALGGIHGGRVLDVATGRGGFAQVLVEKLGGYRQIVGVDLTASMIAAAANEVTADNVHFIRMDAERLGFGDGSFDTVSLSASLHHLSDAASVFVEIRRTLKIGGRLIVAEMHRDVTTEQELTSVRLHTWAAGVDLALGWPHHATLTRQGILDLVGALDLANLSVYDWIDVDSDPLDEEMIASLEGVLDRYLSEARGLEGYQEIEAQADALRRRFREFGARDEPRIIIVGEKP
ncbi:MAG: class I SAM-dependent methyltransferase [Anaerolineae bacterium]|jgi:SAM-dependent methyltransferase